MAPTINETQSASGSTLELVSRLGHGGMGEVFLARRHTFGGVSKLFALKRLLPQLESNGAFAELLLAEARLVSMVSHPNVCQVFDVGVLDGRYYMLMEHLHGFSVARLFASLRSGKPADVRFIAGLIVQVCEALHYCHELRDENGESLELIHRDVSPANLFITVHGVVKLLDFGVAKTKGPGERTRVGVVKGKPAYVAPEVLSTRSPDRRADVFSLGVVLWELLTGQRLFLRADPMATFKAVRTHQPENVAALRADVSSGLAAVIERALSRDPESRFATARDFGRAIANTVTGGPMSVIEIAAALRGPAAPPEDANTLVVSAPEPDEMPCGTPTALDGQEPSVSATAPRRTARVMSLLAASSLLAAAVVSSLLIL